MSRVYFIKPVGMDGPVKIGFSRSPERRLAEISVWCPFPLEIAALVPGGEAVERQFQAKFAHLRTHHEWFRADAELLATIAQLQAGSFDLATLPEGRRHWIPNPRGWNINRARSEKAA